MKFRKFFATLFAPPREPATAAAMWTMWIAEVQDRCAAANEVTA